MSKASTHVPLPPRPALYSRPPKHPTWTAASSLLRAQPHAPARQQAGLRADTGLSCAPCPARRQPDLRPLRTAATERPLPASGLSFSHVASRDSNLFLCLAVSHLALELGFDTASSETLPSPGLARCLVPTLRARPVSLRASRLVVRIRVLPPTAGTLLDSEAVTSVHCYFSSVGRSAWHRAGADRWKEK